MDSYLSCSAGAYSSAGSSACSDCPAGRYQDQGESSNCLVFISGQFESSTASTGCDACPGGHYCPRSGVKNYSTCEPGTFSSSDAVACSGCGIRQISPAASPPTTRKTSTAGRRSRWSQRPCTATNARAATTRQASRRWCARPAGQGVLPILERSTAACAFPANGRLLGTATAATAAPGASQTSRGALRALPAARGRS
mmetsp:Transcript_42088/g.71531  ORF Transcript_42088/g.71531 Transcript_42088/m.71531 type:complete len:198 (-) Transcript_42088:1566-2159(-)